MTTNPLPKMDNKMYMDYVEETLDDCIYGRVSGIGDIISYSKQIIQGVGILQKSGVVHRDLKPDNLLIQTSKTDNFNRIKKIKIIDFGQSSLVSDSFKGKNMEQ